jgi:prophage maintenance system killer protein
MFLELNGYELVAPDTDMFGEVIEKLITGGVDEETFTAAIRDCVHPLPED